MKRFLLRQVSLALLSVLLLNLAVFGQSSPKNIYTKSQTLKANDPKYLNKPYQLHRVTMKSGVKYLVHAHGPFPTNFHLFTSKGKGIVQAKHQNNHAYYYFTPNTDDNYLIVVTTRDVKRVGKYDLRVLEYPKVVVKGGGTMSQTAKDIQSKVTQTESGRHLCSHRLFDDVA